MPVLADPLIPVVFAEAQMQPDERFYGRYFSQLFLHLYQYEVSRDWRGLLILQSRGQKLGPELPYRNLLDNYVTRLYLTDLQAKQGLSPNLALLQLLTMDQSQTAEVGKALLKQAETEAEFKRRLSLIETILANKFPDLTKEMIMQILDLKQMDVTKSLFYQEIIQEGLEKGREQGLEQGLEKGLQAGFKKGRQEGEADLILRQLRRRLGELSGNQVEQIRQLSVSYLESLGEALLDFTAVSDLEEFFTRLK